MKQVEEHNMRNGKQRKYSVFVILFNRTHGKKTFKNICFSFFHGVGERKNFSYLKHETIHRVTQI